MRAYILSPYKLYFSHIYNRCEISTQSLTQGWMSRLECEDCTAKAASQFFFFFFTIEVEVDPISNL